MNRVSTVLSAATLAMVLMAGSSLAAPAAPAPGTCLDDWSDAAPIVVSEGLTPARDIQIHARRHYASDLVRITLCREEGGYVYRLLLRDDRGRINHLKINALPVSASAASAAER